jgi:hypothetical protein
MLIAAGGARRKALPRPWKSDVDRQREGFLSRLITRETENSNPLPSSGESGETADNRMRGVSNASAGHPAGHCGT